MEKNENLTDTAAQTTNQVKDYISEKTQAAKSSLSELANQSVNSIVEAKNKTFEVISQTTDSAVKGTEAAKNYLSELANQSVNSIVEAKNQSVEVIDETTKSAVSGVSKITTQTKEVMAETVKTMTDTAANTTSQAVESVTEVADNIMQIREGLSYRMTEVIQNYISPAITEWINSHPLTFWLLNHPLITLVGSLFLILILLGFLQVVNDLGKSLFLFILTTPFKVFKIIWILSNKFTNKNYSNATDLGKNLTLADSSNKIINNRQRLMQILTRLEEIKKEQDLLLQEAAKIIKSQSKFK